MAPLTGLREHHLAGQGLVGQGLAGLAAAGGNAASQFLIMLVVTGSLDPESAGAFCTATAMCLMLAGILRLDAGNGLIHILARGMAIDVMRTTLAPVAVLAVAAAGALVVGRQPLAELTAVPEAAWAVLAGALPAVVLADVLVAATRATGTMRPTLLLRGIAQPLGQLALVAVAARTEATPPVLVAAWALPSVPVAALAASWLRRRGRPYPSAADGPPGTVAAFWRHTAPRSAAAAIQSVFQRLDIVIVALLAGPAPTAVYTAATRFKVVGQVAGQGLAQAIQPRLVSALGDGDLARAARLYQTGTIWLVALTWPIWLGYAALAHWLLPLFGPAYAGGVAVALVLSATMMLATACGMVDLVLIAAGHTTASLLNTAAAVTVTVALDVLLVPGHGPLGAAIGWSGGVLAKNLLPLVQISRRYRLRPFGRHTLVALRFRVVAA